MLGPGTRKRKRRTRGRRLSHTAFHNIHNIQFSNLNNIRLGECLTVIQCLPRAGYNKSYSDILLRTSLIRRLETWNTGNVRLLSNIITADSVTLIFFLDGVSLPLSGYVSVRVLGVGESYNVVTF